MKVGKWLSRVLLIQVAYFWRRAVLDINLDTDFPEQFDELIVIIFAKADKSLYLTLQPFERSVPSPPGGASIS